MAARERRIKALEREVAKAGEEVEGERDRAAKAATDKAGLQEKVGGRAGGSTGGVYSDICVDGCRKVLLACVCMLVICCRVALAASGAHACVTWVKGISCGRHAPR